MTQQSAWASCLHGFPLPPRQVPWKSDWKVQTGWYCIKRDLCHSCRTLSLWNPVFIKRAANKSALHPRRINCLAIPLLLSIQTFLEKKNNSEEKLVHAMQKQYRIVSQHYSLLLWCHLQLLANDAEYLEPLIHKDFQNDNTLIFKNKYYFWESFRFTEKMWIKYSIII